MDTIIRVVCRPKLKLRFYSPYGHSIHCAIQNIPIGDRYLIQRRTVQELTVLIALSDMSTDNFLDQLIYGDNIVRLIGFGSSTEKSRHVMLPPSKLCIDLEIARASESRALAFDENDELKIKLHEGIFNAEIVICADGKESVIYRDFKVNLSEPFIEWKQDGEINL